MDVNLTGKTALITGGTKGIGRGIALALAVAGANVAVAYRQDGEAADALATELKEIGGDHHLIQADVTQADDVDRLMDECRTRLGSLDVVVNNAGVISFVPADKLPPAEWQRMIDNNLTAAFLVSQRALPLLDEGASVINIGSAAAFLGMPLRAHYTAAKAGLVGLTRSMVKELGPRGIRVNVVSPGPVETDDDEEKYEALRTHYAPNVPLRRLGAVEDVAGVVLFLASDLSRYVTGANIPVDGGF
jgi:3-oxoacyl-[acyl-carrier protein] reductase